MLKGMAKQLDSDLWIIDTLFQGMPGAIASYLLTGDEGLALIDVGPGATVEQLLAGIGAAGFASEDVLHLVLTHIHMDHAGAAGALLQWMPRARVYVHRHGASHLADPSRLMSSARRIYGETMDELWGTMAPVPVDRLQVLEDEQSLRVGGRTLRALYTPGHAIHHLAYFDAERRVMFPGDAAGVQLEGSDFARPPTPPPDLNLEDWYASLDRIGALDPVALYLPHYGYVGAVTSHLSDLRRRLGLWGELILSGMRRNQPDEELAHMLVALTDAEIAASNPHDAALVERYELVSNYLMSAQGYMRYYRKVHPELLV
jgi:glyoxylase-like metal-dependent hydrolase (beta-lactamase superfamily II)